MRLPRLWPTFLTAVVAGVATPEADCSWPVPAYAQACGQAGSTGRSCQGLLQISTRPAGGQAGGALGAPEGGGLGGSSFNTEAVEDLETSVRRGVCWQLSKTDEPFGVHVNATCPDECPFSQPLAGDACWKACLAPGQCDEIHPARIFSDPETLQCEQACGPRPEDRVSGCLECASLGRCRRCMAFHSPSQDGQVCVNRLQWLWITLYVLVGLAIVAAIVFAVKLYIKPTVNPNLVLDALAHRKNCRPQALVRPPLGGSEVWQEFPLRTTCVASQDVGGLGIVLYFRWLRFLFFVGVTLLLGTSAAYYIPLSAIGLGKPAAAVKMDSHQCPYVLNESAFAENATTASAEDRARQQASLLEFRPVVRLRNPLKFRPMSGRKTNSKKSKGKDEEDDDYVTPVGDLNEFPMRMCVAMTVLYLGISGLSLAFSMSQFSLARHWASKRPQHSGFALLVRGLPKEATDPEDLRRFFQDHLDSISGDITSRTAEPIFEVIGVSIAYDYGAHESVVTNMADKVIEDLTKSNAPQTTVSDAGSARVASRGAPQPKRKSSHSPRPKRKSSPSPAPAAEPDVLVPSRPGTIQRLREQGIGIVRSTMTPSPKVDDVQASEVLAGLKATGSVILVLASEEAAKALLTAPTPHFPASEGELRFLSLAAEPPDILWDSFGRKLTSIKVLKLILMFPAAILAFVALYVPYAVHYAVVISNATGGPGEAGMQDFLLGLCIAGGNQLVSIVTYRITGQLGLIDKGQHDTLVLSMVFLGTFINTACDIGTIIVMTRGVVFGNLVYGENVHNGYDRKVATELMNLFVPGYILLPYAIAPIMENVIPYFTQRRNVQSQKAMTLRAAEKAMTPPEFDLGWRYADILNIFCMCLFMLLFTTPNGHYIMIWLLVFLMLLLWMDRLRLLRYTSQTFYTTEALSTAFSYWWALPTGLIGGITAWWASEAELLPLPAPLALAFALLLHVGFYCAILHALFVAWVAPQPTQEFSYTEMCQSAWSEGRVYTYFNTNPVQVLRSRLQPELSAGEQDDRAAFGDAARVPYAKGKTHLQPRTPSKILPSDFQARLQGKP
mmetsp:Transcript_37341/g.79341  ORF Transcript_37341/g.79341 Transcript_37341/m.79341 type:complete len:1067 (-) Transcript_37341:41-3241(-)